MGSSALEALVTCGRAIQNGNLKLTDSLLELIWKLAAEEPDEQQSKVVKYFAEALVRRAYGLHPTIPYNLQWLPYGFAYVIDDVINTAVTKKKRLHVIDFDFPHLYGWGSLVGELSNRSDVDPLQVRVSVILPPFMEKTVNIQEEKQCLITWAKESKVDLQEDLKVVYANSLGEVDSSMLDFRRSKDEAVVVYYIFKLHTLLAEAGALERELLKLRQINPELVIIKEQDANNNDPNFIKRLEDSFHYYSDAFRFDGCSYPKIENYYRRQIRNIIGCEGKDRIVRHETLSQWRSRLLTFGFLSVPLQPNPMLCTIYGNKIQQQNGCLVLSRENSPMVLSQENRPMVLSQENRPMFFISAWKLTHWEDHYNLVNYNIIQGFSPSPPLENYVLQPLQLLPEGFSLNRLAAFAEIYDMLEDVCSRYELPLAITWACIANYMKQNLDGTMSDPILCVANTYSYVNDWKAEQFMKVCAKQNHLLEGQAIARKALQSNEAYHFEPSIDESKKFYHPFASVAHEFGPHAAIAICLQSHYNDVYVVEFFLPQFETKFEKSESLALHIFNDLTNMKKMFVRLRVHGTEGTSFQEETISNSQQVTMLMRGPPLASFTNDFLTSNTSSLNPVESRIDHLVLQIPRSSEQGGVISSFNLVNSTTIDFSSVSISPFNALNPMRCGEVLETQGPCKQGIREKNCISQTTLNGDNDSQKANHETCAVRQTKQRKLKSKVWEDFVKFEENGKQLAKCNHCHKDFQGSSKSGTTHLKNHLKSCPSKKVKLDQERQLKFSAETGDSATQDASERNSIFDQERSRLDFAKMIIKHQYPLDMAEQEFFKSFVKNLQPMFELQSQAIILSDIDHIYKEEKKKLRQYFDQLACNFSLTISILKDSLGKSGYCCLIAHFIDDDWMLRRKILALKRLEHIYDTEVLSGIIRSSLSDWNLSKKIRSIAVDTSSNNGIVQQIIESCLRDQGSFISSHCFTSCTVVHDGLHEIQGILLKIRESIAYASQTSLGNLKFQAAANQVKLQGEKSRDDLLLRLDTDLGILDNASELKEIFCQLEKIDGNFKANPSMEEWDEALALHSCLKGLYDSSFKGIQPLTSNVYFPQLCNIYKKFLQSEMSSYPFASLLKRKFNEHWSLCNLVFAVAAVLDPRLNFKFVEFSYSEIYGCESSLQLNRFHNVLMNVYSEFANEHRNLTGSASASEFHCVTRESTHNAASDCILDSFSKIASTNNFNEVASWKSELDRYLVEPLVPLHGTFFDILGWWRVNSERFPILGRMARDYLAMSFVSPCSDFNTVITNPAYSSLNHESMEALVCSQNWLEMPKGNYGAYHVPTKNAAKRKMGERGTSVAKSCKNWNYDKTIVADKSKATYKMNVQQEKRASFKFSEFQFSSFESDCKIAWREQGAWREEDVRAYLVSNFTEKEKKRINRWQSRKMSGELVGRDKEFGIVDYKLTPLLIVLHGVKTGKEYYIEDTVVNTFFKLLKKRSDEFPMAYINHYSFDSVIATYLIVGYRSEHEVLAWFKDDKQLIGVHKFFLPICISEHWILFHVDTKKQKFSWLDSNKASRMSNEREKEIILRWFKRLLLALSYSTANDWPFEVPDDIPEQTNLIDCGLFAMKYADCLTHSDLFPFAQQDMAHFRHRTFLDLYRGRLHRPKHVKENL